MFFKAFTDELEKIAREFGVRTTSRYPKRDLKRLKARIRPKGYEHRDESLAASEFIEVPAGSALGRMGPQDRGR